VFLLDKNDSQIALRKKNVDNCSLTIHNPELNVAFQVFLECQMLKEIGSQFDQQK
jgi:hypothetical protein